MVKRQNGIRATPAGIDLLPGDRSIETAALELYDSPTGFLRLRRVLTPIEGYDAMLLDTPPALGFALSSAVLAAGRNGIFGKRALMRLSPDLVTKYFVAAGDDQWRILDTIRQSVRFTSVNLIEAAETRPHGRFDVIFCRNVLIYFDDASRRVAAENLYENLLPGGYICLGHTESMSRISPLFEVCRYSDAIVYQRPA